MKSIRHFFSKTSSISTSSSILLGSLLIALSIVVHGFIVIHSQPKVAVPAFTGRSIDKTDHVEGSKNSDVIVMEYSDPECPFCVTLYPTLKQIRNQYEDKVAFVYRHFPLTQIHPHAFDEARAISCAGQIGGEKKFFEYMDALFGYKSNNQTTELPSTGKEDLAKGAGIDVNAFNQCMQSSGSVDAMNASITDGVNAGVEGTPTTFILKKNGSNYDVIASISGAQSAAYFTAAIEEALKN
ncbi:MAG: oxidoreductase [Candidatus Nomurabacteria bacterium]|nr:oxidoreductase [Candidatus Nomurabacteria bacterium]